MAHELQQIIQRIVRHNLFPQLVKEEQNIAAGLPPQSDINGLVGGGTTKANSLNSSSTDARERRRLVSRTRVLKADIARYEADFRASYGHEPKQAERGSMSGTYEEYRTLKLVIRDSAALHIQSAYRGHRARMFVQKLRASTATQQQGGGKGKNNSSSSGNNGTALGGMKASSSAAATASNAPPTIIISSSSSSFMTPALLKLQQLRDEKASLKRRLRAFDVDFANTHGGRAPTKAEKEHLRPDYTRYHELKNLITEAEVAAGVASTGGGRSDSPPPPAPPAQPPTTSTTAAAMTNAKSMPNLAANPTARTAASTGTERRGSVGSTASGSSSNNTTTTTAAINENRLRSDSGASGFGLDDAEEDDLDPTAVGGGGGGNSAGSGSYNGPGSNIDPKSGSGGGSSNNNNRVFDAATLEKISMLKTEKKKLQSVLREYEKDFLARHGRAVKYVKDINPVMEKYTRYKSLKSQLKEYGL